MGMKSFFNRISVRFLIVLFVALLIPFGATVVDLMDRLEAADSRVHATLDRVVDQGVWRQAQVIDQARTVVSVASQVPILANASLQRRARAKRSWLISSNRALGPPAHGWRHLMVESSATPWAPRIRPISPTAPISRKRCARENK